MAEKYVVFKIEDWIKFAQNNRLTELNDVPWTMDDAVVIRRQDVFAPPALDAYANSIQVALSLMSPEARQKFPQLGEIADYFHEQAQLSWDTNRKVPD